MHIQARYWSGLLLATLAAWPAVAQQREATSVSTTSTDPLARARTLAQGDAAARAEARAIFESIRLDAGTAGDAVTEAAASEALGDLLINIGADLGTAATLLTRAADLYRERQQASEAARARTLSGVAFRRVGRLDDAEAAHRRALAEYTALGDGAGEAQVQHNLGALLFSRARYDEAVALFTASIETRKRMGLQALTTSSLNSLGTIHGNRGRPDLALASHAEALAIAHTSGRPADQAYATLGLGSQSYALGEYQDALGYLTDAATLFEGIGDRSGLAYARHTLGVVQLTLGHVDEAVTALEQVVPLRQEDPARLGTTLQSLGNAYRMRGDVEAARRVIEQALVLKRRGSDERGEAATLRSLSGLLTAAGDVEGAAARAAEARALSLRLGDVDGAALALALESRARGSRVGANVAASLAEAADEADARRSTSTATVVRSELARVALASGDVARARDLLARAIAGVEQLRGSIASLDLRSLYLASQADLLDLHVDVLLRSHVIDPTAGHDRAALEAAERLRARRLLDALGDAAVPAASANPTRAQERDLERRVSMAAARLDQARSRLPEERAELDAELGRHLAALRTFRTETRLRLPWRREPPSFDLMQLQPALNEDETVLAYWMGQHTAAAWVVRARSVIVVPLGPSADLRRRIDLTWRAMSTQDAATPAALRDLSDHLLRPVEAHLRTARLAIVVDGLLERVPFAALPTAVGAPLVEEFAITRWPSMMWPLHRGDVHRGRPRRVAVIADPVFSVDDARVIRPRSKQTATPAATATDVGHTSAGRDFSTPARLPFSRLEADAVAAVAGEVQRLEGLEASKTLLAQLPFDRVDVVHFATHAEQHAARADLSGILLSLVDDKGASVDGRVRLHEIVSLPLSGQVIVLSACRTLDGPDMRGEGLQSLARGFLQAGAGSVVASLWDVDDRATMTVMRLFHTALLRDGLSPARALADAQRRMRAERRWQDPAHWAGFVVMGARQ